MFIGNPTPVSSHKSATRKHAQFDDIEEIAEYSDNNHTSRKRKAAIQDDDVESDDERDRKPCRKRHSTVIKDDDMELDDRNKRDREPRRKHRSTVAKDESESSSSDDIKPSRYHSKRRGDEGIFDNNKWEESSCLVPSPSGSSIRLKDQHATMQLILQGSFDVATTNILLMDAWPDTQDVEWICSILVSSARIVKDNAEARVAKAEDSKARAIHLSTVNEAMAIIARFNAQNEFVRAAFKMVSLFCSFFLTMPT